MFPQCGLNNGRADGRARMPTQLFPWSAMVVNLRRRFTRRFGQPVSPVLEREERESRRGKERGNGKEGGDANKERERNPLSGPKLFGCSHDDELTRRVGSETGISTFFVTYIRHCITERARTNLRRGGTKQVRKTDGKTDRPRRRREGNYGTERNRNWNTETTYDFRVEEEEEEEDGE